MKKLNLLLVALIVITFFVQVRPHHPIPVLAFGLVPALDLPSSVEGCSETYNFSGTLHNPNGWGASVDLEASEDSPWIRSVFVSSEGHVGAGGTIGVDVTVVMEEGWAGQYGESEFLTISAFFRADGCANISPGTATTIAIVNSCELCSRMTDWQLVSTRDWIWDPEKGDFYRILDYERYDVYFTDHICDTRQETEWQGLCEECRGERVVEIPEDERGEWELYDKKPDGTKLYRRPLTRDKYTGAICSWEYKTIEPCVRCAVDVITWGGWGGITNTLLVGGTEQPWQFTGVNSSGDAQTTWFFWPPQGAKWNIEARVGDPPGKDSNRWQTRFIGVKRGGPFEEKPIVAGEPVATVGRCDRVTFYFQLLDTGALEPPDPPSDPPVDPPDDPPAADPSEGSLVATNPPSDSPQAEPADPPDDPPENPLGKTHTVVEGECLWSIWEDEGRPDSWGDWLKAVAELNGLDNPDLLSIGQVLVLPG